jgi:hypothetical protein
MRNEKTHKKLHNEYIPTFEEARKMIDLWLNFKNSQPCPNFPNKTILEVLENRKRQNIDADRLDDLMMATEVKTIQRNGIRFLGCDYFDERLYGFKSRVLIRYSIFDLSHIKVFTIKGEFLCRAERVTETHPMARILGTVHDLENFKQKIEKQKKLKRRTINSIKNYLPKEDLRFIETQMLEQNEIKQEFKQRLIGDKPIFKNNLEKYEWLIKNEPANQWLEEFKNSKEYKIYYE